MTFYLIGLGLSTKSISVEALEAVKSCDKIYLESYTVDFPYTIKELEQVLDKKITSLGREPVESEKFVESAKGTNVALLVYGSPLSATTHISLILKCKKEKIPYKVFQNASILGAIAETGLQLYKFGKTASMPKWTSSHKPTSFMNIIKENQSVKAHTLLLTDIGLDAQSALQQLSDSAKGELPKEILIVSSAGTKKQKIFYDSPEKLEKTKIVLPFCIIIPSELHFLEKEAVEAFSE